MFFRAQSDEEIRKALKPPNDMGKFAQQAYAEILKEKNYIHASEKLSEALKINPKNKFALLLRAFSKKELKDYKSALKALNTILKIDSEYNAAVALRAWVNIKLENYPEAIDDYSKLIAYDLMLKDSYGNRGFLKEIMHLI